MAQRVLIPVEGSRTGLLYFQATQRLGLHPIALSADPGQYDHLAADSIEAIRVDTDDLDALIAECSRLRATYDIAGIACAKETVYAMVAKLCRYFDLAGPNSTSIERCCDTFTQRQLLAEAGVPGPSYRLATNAADLESHAAGIGLSVILKPVVGVGSSGIRLCRNVVGRPHDLSVGREAHMAIVWQSWLRILVEEFAQGPYHGAEIMGNEVIGIVAAEFGLPPYFVFREFTFPALLWDDEHKRIADLSLSCLRTLGLGWEPTCIEFRRTKHGPVVIEINPRLADTPDPQLVQLAYRIDLITEHIKLVIGEEWDLRRRHSQIAAARIFLIAMAPSIGSTAIIGRLLYQTSPRLNSILGPIRRSSGRAITGTGSHMLSPPHPAVL